MQYGVVYKITNLENDKCYIGRTKNNLRYRWNNHCRSSSNCVYLKHAIKKYGKESFTIEAIASSWDVVNLKKLEAQLIEQEKTLAPNGYNLRKDTERGVSEISEETRKKISKAGRGRTHSEASKQRMSEGRKGMIFTEEHCHNISRGKAGAVSLMKGKKFSDESRKNMGGQNKGKSASAETKEKMSIVRKGQHWYTDGVRDCKIRDVESVPDGFRRGRTKGLDNLPMLAELWNNIEYRQHMSDIHKKVDHNINKS